jgi:hypothetical protein
MSDDYGFRLFDESIVASTFDVVKQYTARFHRGANDVTAEILKTALPLKGLLMRYSIGRNEPIDVDISDAEYSKERTGYAEAMLSLYGATSFTIFPIIADAESGTRVIALYPTSLNSEIAQVLGIHRRQLRQICINSYNKIKSTLAVLDRASTKDETANSWAALAGRLLTGLPLVERRVVSAAKTVSVRNQPAFWIDQAEKLIFWNGKLYHVSPLQLECILAFTKMGKKVVHQRSILNAVRTDSERLHSSAR